MNREKYNPYRILKLPNFATLSQIKTAYKKAAKKFHPDSTIEPNQEKFIACKNAYDFLMDENKKLRLDFELRQEETNKSNRKSQENTRQRRKANPKQKTVLEQEEYSWEEIVVGAALVFGAGYLFGRYKKDKTT